MIRLLIILLQENHRVLALGHLKVLQHTSLLTRPLTHAKRIGLETMSRTPSWQGIDMNGDKEVGLVLVGNLCPAVQLHKTVCLSGIDHFDIRTVALHHSAESQRITQCQVLLLRDSPHCSGIMSAMPRINNQRKPVVRSICRYHKTTYCYQK